MSNPDLTPETRPTAHSDVRVDLGSADFQVSRLPGLNNAGTNLNFDRASEVTPLMTLNITGSSHEGHAGAHHLPAHHVEGHHSQPHHQYYVAPHHTESHHAESQHAEPHQYHAAPHHVESHHTESHHTAPHRSYHPAHHQYVAEGAYQPLQLPETPQEHPGASTGDRYSQGQAISPSQREQVAEAWRARMIFPHGDTTGDASSRDLPAGPRQRTLDSLRLFDSSVPGSNSWTEHVLQDTIGNLEGKSPRTLDASIDPRLGCAICVSQFAHRAYGIPVTASVANMEESMRSRHFERVPFNKETIAHLQQGDIIVGHRNGTLNGQPMHGHVAVYTGDGQVFNNNALQKKMISESLSVFQEPLYQNGRMHMNGYSDVWIYRPQTNHAAA